ncbi:DUF397 domain-containing protein [Streptomyces albidoflavus]|uniref:DUF397 domain-containing protein n=2 Tax=Streptomyces TaxID=1883 RepID=UPI0036B69D54
MGPFSVSHGDGPVLEKGVGGVSMIDPEWIKSTYSNGSGGDCLEWARGHAVATGLVPVRDSKDTSLPGFTVSGSAWSTFVGSLKAQG